MGSTFYLLPVFEDLVCKLVEAYLGFRGSGLGFGVEGPGFAVYSFVKAHFNC